MLLTLDMLAPTLATTWLVYLMASFFVLVCLFMMLVILIQKPKGGGLSGAFGGAGSAQSVMGAKTGEFLTWFTVACFVLFLLLAMGLTWAINADPHGSGPPSQQPAEAPATGAPGTGTPGTQTPDPLTELPEEQPEAPAAPPAAPAAPAAPAPPEAPAAPQPPTP